MGRHCEALIDAMFYWNEGTCSREAIDLHGLEGASLLDKLLKVKENGA